MIRSAVMVRRCGLASAHGRRRISESAPDRNGMAPRRRASLMTADSWRVLHPMPLSLVLGRYRFLADQQRVERLRRLDKVGSATLAVLQVRQGGFGHLAVVLQVAQDVVPCLSAAGAGHVGRRVNVAADRFPE